MIIVTIKDAAGRFDFDFEIPTDFPMETVVGRIREGLPVFRASGGNASGNTLVSIRTGNTVNMRLSASENGLRNGDCLILMED